MDVANSADARRRRKRTAISCVLCRRRKLRCDRSTPCSNCIRSRTGQCTYDNDHSRSDLRQPPTPSSPSEERDVGRASVTPIQTAGLTSTSRNHAAERVKRSVVRNVDVVRLRCRHEMSVPDPKHDHVQVHDPTSDPDAHMANTALSGTFHFQYASNLPGGSRSVATIHKNRYFGQSHWVNSTPLLLDVLRVMGPYMREKTSKLYLSTQKCKALARTIKQQRSPSWPPQLSLELPPRELADELVMHYVETVESVHRVLHLPTFRDDYRSLWNSAITDQTSLLIQVKLVLAIGSVTYDEHFSLRASAVQWIYEAQLWLAKPEFKSRLTITVYQINILLLLARELVHIGGDMIWTSIGSVIRTAMYMGMHRDPTNMTKQTTLDTEMRRRLWATTMEIALQSSITSGGPPLISPGDYDTRFPRNLDDEQLLQEQPEERGETDPTDMSVALTLLGTLSVRHKVAKHLNDLGPHGAYSDTLALDSELKNAYKDMRRSILLLSSTSSKTSSEYGADVAGFIMLRYMLALHFPFYGPALHETVYSYSRKMVLETSLKLWCAAYPWSIQRSGSPTAPIGKLCLSRLTICGSGFFRSVAFLAGLIIAIEHQAQLGEEESIGHVPLGPDLLSVMEDKKAWELKCMDAGGCSTKGYMISCVLVAHCQGLVQRLPHDELASLLVKTAEQAVETCLPILQSKAGAAGDMHGLDEDPNDFSIPELDDEDWNAMIARSFFNVGDYDFMIQ